MIEKKNIKRHKKIKQNKKKIISRHKNTYETSKTNYFYWLKLKITSGVFFFFHRCRFHKNPQYRSAIQHQRKPFK